MSGQATTPPPEAPPSPFSPEQIAYQMAHINERRDSQVIGTAAALIALSTIAVALRFVARKSRKMNFGLDDWFALLALLFVIPMNALLVSMLQYGMGRHTLAADPTQLWKVIRTGVIFTSTFYSFVHLWIKLSIIFFYKRVFTFRTAWFKWVCVVSGVYAVAWTVTVFFVTLFQCIPVHHFWDQLNPTIQPPSVGRCPIDNHRIALSTSALNSLIDIVLFTLPIFMLWNLHMKLERKIALIAVFATGAIAVVAGLLRLYYTNIGVAPGADVTWIVTDAFLWTCVEASVGLICACLPIIGPLFGLIRDNVKSYLSKQSMQSNSQSYDLSHRDRQRLNSADNSMYNSKNRIDVHTRIDVRSEEGRLSTPKHGV